MTFPTWLNLLLLFGITLAVIATCVSVWAMLASNDAGVHTVGLGFGPWILAVALALACVVATMVVSSLSEQEPPREGDA